MYGKTKKYFISKSVKPSTSKILIFGYFEAKMEVNDLGGKFFFDLRKIYVVTNILTNFYKDPIIRSTNESLVTDSCN